MAIIFPDIDNIKRLKVPPTEGELHLVLYLSTALDDTYEVFFNPYLDGDRPDIIILKEHCAAFIIEVKDWDLRNFAVDKKNEWRVFNKEKSAKKSSPHSQAFRYKKNLYDLHLPVVGLARLTNPNFYNLVKCFVYFHKCSQEDLEQVYAPALESNKAEREETNRNYNDGAMQFQAYDKSMKYLDRKKRNIERDKSISIVADRLDMLIKKIKKDSKHVLFDERVYRDFKRRLSPSEHTLSQGIKIQFDEKQRVLTQSKDGKEKIKGVAGCGKSTVLSQRAINAAARHQTPVLILTYNITLKNYIRDKISDIHGSRNFNFIEISNYHQFFNAQLNNTGQDITALIKEYGLEKMYSLDLFQGQETIKYNTILVDEIQDYQSDWVKIVRDNFLTENGEMVLFGDESQNIYQREASRSPVIAQGFGRWVKLTRSYRTGMDSPLNQLFSDFQMEYLAKKYSDIEIFEVPPTQVGLGYSLLKYESVPSNDWQETVFDSIQGYISSYDLHPNDVVVLCAKIGVIRELNEFWIEREKTHCMFETFEELAACTPLSVEDLKKLSEEDISQLVSEYKESVERVRRAKKNHFYSNSGLIKLSTIHSYKGLESKTVFYILGEKDDPEVIYTSITRSSENLIVFDLKRTNSCSEFFERHMGKSSASSLAVGA